MKKYILLLTITMIVSCKQTDVAEAEPIFIDTSAVSVDTQLHLDSEKSKVDSLQIKKLKSSFNHNTDEFSENAVTWIKPKSAPKFINMNGLYCYFSSNNLRFSLQFHRDSWLFINSCQFLIDGKAFEYIPVNLKRDNDETGITEWFDDPVNDSNKDLIEALANAKEAKVKLIGDKFYDVKVISKKQISSIKETLDYYKALGNYY